MTVRIHPSSFVADGASIGDGTLIWLFCQIREGVKIGTGCVLGTGVYVDSGVTIGKNVKIQNNVSIYHGVTLEDGVFVGPDACFTNDKTPRAINPDGTSKSADDWTVSPTLVRTGASLGANCTVVCGVTVGRWSMVGSGAVVTRNIPDHALVVGNPARIVGWICACGVRLQWTGTRAVCSCGRSLERADDETVRLV
jgi:UDP-2-acetamido-3-amino-2,3-dideoxy-glucuronate N-acetyltransferase